MGVPGIVEFILHHLEIFDSEEREYQSKTVSYQYSSELR